MSETKQSPTTHFTGYVPMTMEEAKQVLDGSVNGCGHHEPVEFGGDDIAELLYSFASQDSWESDSFALVKLKDGRFATFWEASDATGHG